MSLSTRPIDSHASRVPRHLLQIGVPTNDLFKVIVSAVCQDQGTDEMKSKNGKQHSMDMTDCLGSRTFKRAGIGVTSPVLSDGSANYTPSGENRAGVKTAYHGGLKSFDSQTNSAQSVVGQRLTDAFGNQISGSGVWKGRFAYGGPYGYQEDPDTGLRLLGHRYYDSSTGRFLTRDPIKDGRNWYVYCDNAPISRIDPDGLAYLVFDGTSLTLYSDDGSGPSPVFSVPAASGLPGKSKKDQFDKGGPIPEGEYFIDPNDYAEFTSDPTVAQLPGFYGPMSSERRSWGGARVGIHPKDHTNTHLRGGFLIHGGAYVGSAGCIDVGPNDWLVISLILLYSRGKKMTLYVDYSGKRPEGRHNRWDGHVPGGEKGLPIAWRDW